MKAIVRRMIRDRKAATAIEYGLILAVIVLGMLGALGGVADATIGLWNNVSTKVVKAG